MRLPIGAERDWEVPSPCALSLVTAGRRARELSGELWGVLYRALDHVADSGDARWQAGGRALRAVNGRHAVCDFRETGAAGILRQPASE